MQPHDTSFILIFSTSQLELAPHPLNIRTTNGFTMFGHNIGSILTSNLSVPRVFNVSNLSYNLFSVGQLAELSYRITFDYSECIVQDPRSRQELRTSPRVRRMFPVDNLCLPPVALVSDTSTATIVSFIPSLALRHA